jgi:FlaG/FlaF family flagellin (archaellin)
MDKNPYHFGGIEDWIADAIHSGMSADTIYKEVVGAIRRQVKHHKDCHKTSKELHKLFSNRQYFDVVGDDSDIVNDKINATSPYNDGWTQDFYKNKIKTTKINIAVPDHPDYTEL